MDEEIIYILDEYDWAHENWIKEQTQVWLDKYIAAFLKWYAYKKRKDERQ